MKENLSPVMREGKNLRQFENFKIYGDLCGKTLGYDRARD